MNNKPILFFNAYKKVISRLFLIMALWLILGDAAWAGPYILVMSKNKALCESMLGLYNKDMDTYGRIDYDSHERFSRINWQRIDDLHKPHVPPTTVWSIFDINNDGKKELVIKTKLQEFNYFNETLYIFPEASDVLSKLNSGKNGLDALLLTSNFLFGDDTNKSYYLKNVPDLLQEKILAYKLKHLPKYLKKVNSRP